MKPLREKMVQRSDQCLHQSLHVLINSLLAAHHPHGLAVQTLGSVTIAAVLSCHC